MDIMVRLDYEWTESLPQLCSKSAARWEDYGALPRNTDLFDGFLEDRNGSLWITTDTFGLGRVPHPERLRDRPISKNSDALQRFSSKGGLSADACTPILEDREGNIWVATRDGLDQFRDTALVPIALPTSLIRIAIAPADGGDIWVAGTWNYVARIHGDSTNVSLVPADAFKPYRRCANSPARHRRANGARARR